MRVINFTLTNHIYAARFDDSIIILDSINDKYFSLIDSAADFFQVILDNSFEQKNDSYFIVHNENHQTDVEDLNYWINHFITHNFITKTASERGRGIASLPLQSGGLIDYKWDHKPSWQPFVHTSKIQIIKMLFTLAKAHRLLNKKGIQGILDEIKKYSIKKLHQPTDQEIQKLSETIDAATLLYPKKTYCLAWAATFVIEALKRQWKCNLAIGIQTNPFYAHAWAECSGSVIHDDPQIAQVLSIILREPFN